MARQLLNGGFIAQVDEDEVAAGLGPGWPSARVLANLQQHCIALSYEACQHSSQGTNFLYLFSCELRLTLPSAACQPCPDSKCSTVRMSWQSYTL